MKRRSALRSLALLMGGTIALPAWAQAWSPDSVAAIQNSLATPDQEALLAEIVETIIPTTDSPGAKAVGVQLFILKMLADCYEKKEQTRFFNGLDEFDNLVRSGYGQSFIACSAAQRLEILKGREEAGKSLPAEKAPFFPFLKNMTIQGYLNSEFVMRDVFKYELVPGRYHGSVPVQPSAKR